MWHVSFDCVTWLIHTSVASHIVAKLAAWRIVWRCHICDTHTHFFAKRHVTYECVVLHMNESCHAFNWGMSHMCVRHFLHVTNVMSQMWHASDKRHVTFVTCHICASDISCMSCHKCDMPLVWRHICDMPQLSILQSQHMCVRHFLHVMSLV